MSHNVPTQQLSGIPFLRQLRKRMVPSHVRTKLEVLRHGLRYRSILGFTDIDGWLSPTEAVRLYDLADATPSINPVVVEIGSWQGKSSVVLAQALADKVDARLYCIDPFNADGDQFSRDEYARREATLVRPLIEQFEANMRRHRVADCVRPMAGYSHELVKTFTEKIDLLFVDGNHAYDAVMRDFADWSPLIKPGGVIAFHDVDAAGEQLGPWRVVQEQVRENTNWDPIGHWDSLYAARRVGTSVTATTEAPSAAVEIAGELRDE